MNLIAEFNLDDNLTPEESAKVADALGHHLDCNGVFIYDAPLHHQGRASFDHPYGDDLERRVKELFERLRGVKNFELQWTTPAVMG